MSEKLLNCPFCGGEAELCETIGQSDDVDNPHDDVPESIFLVQCKSEKCAYNTWLLDQAQAIAAWNTRSSVEGETVDIDKRIEAAAEEIVRELNRPPTRSEMLDWSGPNLKDEVSAILKRHLEGGK